MEEEEEEEKEEEKEEEEEKVTWHLEAMRMTALATASRRHRSVKKARGIQKETLLRKTWLVRRWRKVVKTLRKKLLLHFQN